MIEVTHLIRSSVIYTLLLIYEKLLQLQSSGRGGWELFPP